MRKKTFGHSLTPDSISSKSEKMYDVMEVVVFHVLQVEGD